MQTVEAGSNEKRALPSASIVILAKSDSAFIKGITSDKNGRFILNYQPQKKKKYLLKVSFMGMQSVYRAPRSFQMPMESSSTPSRSKTAALVMQHFLRGGLQVGGCLLDVLCRVNCADDRDAADAAARELRDIFLRDAADGDNRDEIGRASCRERV